MNSREQPIKNLGLLKKVKTRLKNTYGDRLCGIVLYGSEARGNATSASDLDILVVLKGPVSLGQDLRKIIDVLYPLQLEIDRPIHAMPVDVDVYEAAEFALYRNAKRQGFVL